MQARGSAAAHDRFARPDIAELTIELATSRSPGARQRDDRNATIWIVSSLARSVIPSATTDDPETSWLILVLNPSYLSSSWLDGGQLSVLTSGELRVV